MVSKICCYVLSSALALSLLIGPGTNRTEAAEPASTGVTAAEETAAPASTGATAAEETAAPASTGATAAEETAAPASTGDAAAEEAAAPSAAGGSPWIDSDLKANITADMKLSPREDFHLYVNHDWLLKTDLPAGYRSYSSFAEVADEIEKKAQAVLTDDSLTGHDAELVQSYYRAILDWDSRNAAGIEPLLPTVKDIQEIDSMEELSDFICDPERDPFVPVIASISNSTDFNDSNRYITSVYTESYILDDSAEYKKRTEMGDRAYEAGLYKTKALLPRLGYTEQEAEEMFRTVIDLEGKLAEVSMTNEEWMSPDHLDKINNIYTPGELDKLSPAFPLTRLIEADGYGAAEKFLVPEPAIIERLNELYTAENLEAFKAYMIQGYVTSLADSLDSRAYDVAVKAGNIEQGSEGRQSDEKTAFNIVRGALYTPMDRAYLERYDATKQKEQITSICRQVVASYRTMLEGEDWLSEETRARAIEKLDTLRINAVYPDKWLDYSRLNLKGLSYIDCRKEISRFNREENCSHTNGTVDRDIWKFDILETNAYYNPTENSINIILGILGDPIYYEGITDSALLGGIGAVIGHEISHAFDSSGARYDKDGNYNNWWTDEDYKAFQARTDRLIAYYDSMNAWEGQQIYGSRIQTEAIADLAGLKVMLEIAKTKENFDYKDFFTSFAKVWRRLNTREFEYYCLTQDTHPLHYIRTNAAVRQFDEFNEAFGVKEGDPMYLAPEDRILVW